MKINIWGNVSTFPFWFDRNCCNHSGVIGHKRNLCLFWVLIDRVITVCCKVFQIFIGDLQPAAPGAECYGRFIASMEV